MIRCRSRPADRQTDRYRCRCSMVRCRSRPAYERERERERQTDRQTDRQMQMFDDSLARQLCCQQRLVFPSLSYPKPARLRRMEHTPRPTSLVHGALTELAKLGAAGGRHCALQLLGVAVDDRLVPSAGGRAGARLALGPRRRPHRRTAGRPPSRRHGPRLCVHACPGRRVPVRRSEVCVGRVGCSMWGLGFRV
jgi:hypothetical protein